MKQIIMFFTVVIVSVTNTNAQNTTSENPFKDVQLTASKDYKPIDDQKPCDLLNKSAYKTITVKIEQSILMDNYLEKKMIVVEKLGPNERRFVGYAGCDQSAMHQKCMGYKIAFAYYENNVLTSTVVSK
jgi:hypothetical protein